MALRARIWDVQAREYTTGAGFRKSTDVITRGAASGKTVLGYVRTGYLGVSVQKFTTRLGSGNLADWTAQIEEDIDMWYNLYGDSIGGIFFDEGWPECGDNNQYVGLYKYTYTWTIPLGTSTINSGKFVVQAQGYNPLTNVFYPELVNTLYRGDGEFYSTESGSLSGNCWGDQVAAVESSFKVMAAGLAAMTCGMPTKTFET
ncbi:hypothetical protein BJX63DRAFT_430372 [Aspergillus granulosus]|uniref:Uncharacterized protein n=1 Tax=Aspergillus granulosus TaxID=176169 RepID=A0ABR4HKS1_9EURO